VSRDLLQNWNLLLKQPRKIDDKKRIAVLIDAENAQPTMIINILNEIAKFGSANVKRIYGDWTSSQMNSWKKMLLKYSIQPIQQFKYTTGKNAVDSALIIDAMDLLHTTQYDGFCIISSDSDYTRLASRIRESGLFVIGFGEKKTPEPFIKSCNQFIYTENLLAKFDGPEQVITALKLQKDNELVKLLSSSVKDVSDESGLANLAEVGVIIRNKRPDFDQRTYGYTKLSDLFKAVGLFDLEEKEGVSGNLVYVKISEGY
jgi:uncharacterized LabA/DUF88 family protein